MRNSSRTWILILIAVCLIGILVVVPLMIIWTIQQSTQEALAPVVSANQALKTQVSQFLNPTPTILPDPITIIHDVRALARLETIQFSVEKVITAEQGQGQFSFLFGDKLIFVAHGTVTAGIDLGKVQKSDIRQDGSILHVRLPEPEIFSSALDEKKSYVYDRQTGLLKPENVDLETQARQVAASEIEKAALEDGILNQAKQNGEVYLTRLLNSLGYHDIVFDYAAPVPTGDSSAPTQPDAGTPTP
jgi:hypothetical protein